RCFGLAARRAFGKAVLAVVGRIYAVVDGRSSADAGSSRLAELLSNAGRQTACGRHAVLGRELFGGSTGLQVEGCEKYNCHECEQCSKRAQLQTATSEVHHGVSWG